MSFLLLFAFVLAYNHPLHFIAKVKVIKEAVTIVVKFLHFSFFL